VRQLGDTFNRLEEIIASCLLITTSLFVFMQVVLRYGFGFTLAWIEESARYMIVWFVFLGASIGVREKAHPAMDMLLHIAPKLVKTILQIVVTIICMAFCVTIVRSGISVVVSAYSMGATSPALRVPLFIPYIAVPAGLGLMFIRYALQLKDLVMELIKIKKTGEAE